MRTWKVQIDGILQGVCWPARVSLPLRRGSDSNSCLSVARVDGSVVPAQWRTLVPWPDGSPRWVQLDFQANGPGAYTVRQEPAAAEIILPVLVERRAPAAFAITVGRLQVLINPQARAPISSITWDGRLLTSDARPWDFVAVDTSGRPYPLAAGAAHDVRVDAEGPLRFQVAWETEHRDSAGEPLLRARFRLEFLAGVEGFALSYQFFHVLPGHDFLRLSGLSAGFFFDALAKGGQVALVQPSYSLLGSVRVAKVSGPIRVRLDKTHGSPYVEDVSSLGDTTAYPYFLAAHARNVREAVALEDETTAVTCMMEDFICQRPKEIFARPGEITIDLWPEWAGPLSLPQGRSCAQRFGFRFIDSHGTTSDKMLLSVFGAPAALCVRPALAWLDAADSVEAGPTWDQPRLLRPDEPHAELLSDLLSSAAGAMRMVGEMFHFGDTPGHDYSITYPSSVRFGDPTQPGGELPYNEAGYTYTGLVPRQTLEPVWINNEYDSIYCLALEAIRTRSAQLLWKLHAAARHQIEVDFVHYSDHWQHHRGTPCHTYDHVLHSTAYPSHQWTQGLYHYYCLTGDDDVPEVVRAICDFNIMWLARPELKFAHGFNRELGWGALALVYGYEVTGDEKYREAARSVIEELEQFSYGGRTDGTLDPQCARLIGPVFAASTILMAAKAYHQATGDEWARTLFLKWIDVGLANFNSKAGGMKLTELFPECMTYACELTGDTRCLEDTLWQVRMFMWLYRPDLWNFMSLDGALYGKTFARAYRGLVHYLSACAKAGLLEKAEQMLLEIPGK